MKKVLFLTPPFFYARSPLIGPALLKSILQNKNTEVKIKDLNVDLWDSSFYFSYGKLWFHDTPFEDIYIYEADEFSTFTKSILIPEVYKELDIFLDKWVQEIKEYNPDYIGFCFMSFSSIVISNLLCYKLRKELPFATIIIGGPTATSVELSENEIKDFNFDYNNFDYLIKGEADITLDNLINKGKNIPKVCYGEPTDDLNSLPIPDYSDTEWNRYSDYFFKKPEELGVKRFYITGSRGCVRRCSFCNIPSLWPLFRIRDAQNLFKEIKSQYENFGITNFYFTDSLINGNVKRHWELSLLLKEYYKERKIQPFFFEGQYICRTEKQTPHEYYKDISNAGFKLVKMGVESFSPKVRKDMNKAFRQKDLWHTLYQCTLNNIKVNFLLIVGWPTETDEDFKFSLDFLTELSKYPEYNGCTNSFSITTMYIYNDPDVPVFHQIENYNISFDPDYPANWKTHDGTNNKDIRFERAKIMHDHIKKLNLEKHD